MSANEWMRLIPVLRVNNRSLNQDFYVKVLGMKSLLEEGSQLSLGDLSKTERLVLDESPGTRSRRAVGPKKLARITVKVQEAAEIEQLLALKPAVEAVYRGSAGYAFEALSPEGDLFLLHAEQDAADLTLVKEVPDFEAKEDFSGLSHFEIERIEIRVPHVQQASSLYQKLGLPETVLDFQPAEGPDLLAANAATWDLTGLKYLTADLDTDKLAQLLSDREVFVSKSKKFLVSQDDSHIELWFEQV